MVRDNPDLAVAVTTPTIVTAIAARLDFQSGPLFCWTGMGSITAPAATGDDLLNGQTFDAISPQIVTIGDNTFSMSGSGELTITLNIDTSPPAQLAIASIVPEEFQTRTAVLWRAIKVPATNPLAQPIWLFNRMRVGSMDKLEIQNDGRSHRLIMTIEGHAGRISRATGQTYLNQRLYDPADSSQDSSTAIANGDAIPTKANINASASAIYGGSGYMGGGYGMGRYGFNQSML